MKNKSSSSQFLRKKQNRINPYMKIDKTSKNNGISIPDLLFSLTLLSGVLLYRQIMMTVDKSTSLTITVLRSINITEIPLVISPYIVTLLVYLVALIFIPARLGYYLASDRFCWHFKKSWILRFIILPIVFILAHILYGLLVLATLTLVYGMVYGDSLAAFVEWEQWQEFVLPAAFHNTVFSLISCILPLVLRYYSKNLRGNYLNLKNWGTLGPLSIKHIIFYSFLGSFIFSVSLSPYNEYVDTRSCIKFINGYDPISKKFPKNISHNAYYITAYLLEDSGSTVSVVTTGAAVNPVSSKDMFKYVNLVYVDKKLIEFIKPERCGSYIDSRYKNMYYK